MQPFSHRRSIVVAFVAIMAAVAALTPSAQQEVDWNAVTISAHHVAGSVHYLEGRGGNIGLSIGEDGIVMIDDQYAPLTEKILAAIRQLSDQEIRFVINTHVHPDHTGGNENLGRLGIAILAHDAVRVRLASQLPSVALPVLTYSDTMTAHVNGEEVHAFVVPPAHTDGDSFIYFRRSDVLHLGDVFRTVAFPVIDRNNGGTLQGTIDALGMAIGLAGPATKIIPGHGALSTRQDVMAFRDMILTVAGRVEALVSQDKTYDEVVAAGTTREWEEKLGSPERFLTAVYAELSEGR